MSSRRRKRGHSGGHGAQSLAAAKKSFNVLVREDTGEILHNEDTIDIAAIEKESGDMPRFNFRKPDASSPFDSFKGAKTLVDLMGIDPRKVGDEKGRALSDEIIRRLSRLDAVERYKCLKEQLIDAVDLLKADRNGGESAGRLGAIMAFIGHLLNPEEIARLRREVLADVPDDIYGHVDGWFRYDESERNPSGEPPEWDALSPTEKGALASSVAITLARDFAGKDPVSSAAVHAEILAGTFPLTDGEENSKSGQEFLRAVASHLPPFKPSEPEFKTAADIAHTLQGMPRDQARRILASIANGTATVTDKSLGIGLVAPPKIDSGKLTDALRHMAPHRQERAVSAIKMFGEKGAAPIINPLIQDELKDHNENQGKRRTEINNLERQLTVLDELKAVVHDMRLQRVTESCFHKAIEAWRAGTVILPTMKGELNEQQKLALWKEDSERGIFLLQHNWAGAFNKAADFEDGEFQLPYGETIFETRITGRRFCLCISGASEETLLCILLMESTVGWALVAAYHIQNNTWVPLKDDTDVAAPLMNLLRDQVRAVCIALEAEVAQTELIRAPHKLNQKRERAGKLPLYDFHIVELSNRKRYLPEAPDHGMTEVERRHSPRLHFVRGHWVHYQTRKTWRKWHLRGNPDLGFVDKEYRL